MTSLQKRLNKQSILVADGATGTNLQTMGLQPGDAPERWVLNEPQKILALHHAFIEVGSDIIMTCSFGGNAVRLRETSLPESVSQVNRRAAELAREAADASERPVLVAGSMGPTGQLLEPYGPLRREDVVAAFAEQAFALTEGGVDLLVLETQFSIEEAAAAIEGIQQNTDLPLVCTFSFDRGLRTMMGVSPAQMAETLTAKGVSALGANCGTTLENMQQVVSLLYAHSQGIPIWAKPNAGLPTGTPPAYTVTPDDMAEFALRFVEEGASIVGGCCGSTPAHIRAIRQAIDAAKTTDSTQPKARTN